MIIVRWLRVLLSLPIQWLGLLALYFDLPADVLILRAAWAVGRDTEAARLALAAIHRRQGREAALLQAAVWLEEHPLPFLGAFAGGLALERGDLVAAWDYLARGRAAGDDPMGGLDLLEFAIATAEPDADASEVARRFVTRSDLPPALRRAVEVELMLDDLLSRRFDEATRRADFLLDVAEDPVSEMVLWAAALHAGDAAAAKGHYECAEMPPAQKSYYAFLGHLALGAAAEAQADLERLRAHDEKAALAAEALQRRREGAGVP